jgi:kynurenine formamidase
MTDRVLDAIAAGVTVYDLGREMFTGMPQSSAHPEYRMVVARRHGDLVRRDGSSGASELIVTGGHVGTHIDALAHISYNGKLHGDIDVARAFEHGRFSRLGIETVEPIVARGVLLDVAKALGMVSCPAAYEVTVEDLKAAVDQAKVDLRAGDVILVRTGWGRHLGDRAAYEGEDDGMPGPGESGAAWLAGYSPRAVGSDTLAFERLPGGTDYPLPAHRLLLVERGIHIIEALELEQLAGDEVHEFTFLLSPLELVGATGSPVRPLAVIEAAGRDA